MDMIKLEPVVFCLCVKTETETNLIFNFFFFYKSERKSFERIKNLWCILLSFIFSKEIIGDAYLFPSIDFHDIYNESCFHIKLTLKNNNFTTNFTIFSK